MRQNEKIQKSYTAAICASRRTEKIVVRQVCPRVFETLKHSAIRINIKSVGFARLQATLGACYI